jgi:nucleotide-binding universal stress UspA family protein
MDDWDAYGGELIVMGTNGKTGLTRLILGSVTDSVMRASDKPVIIINDKRGKIKSIKESD